MGCVLNYCTVVALEDTVHSASKPSEIYTTAGPYSKFTVRKRYNTSCHQIILRQIMFTPNIVLQKHQKRNAATPCSKRTERTHASLRVLSRQDELLASRTLCSVHQFATIPRARHSHTQIGCVRSPHGERRNAGRWSRPTGRDAEPVASADAVDWRGRRG